MLNHANYNKVAHGNAIPALKTEQRENERLAFSPAEFAKRFGKHAVWGYRQIYAGRVRILNTGGRMLIPASEIDRFISNVITYSGKNAKDSDSVKSGK